MVVELAVIDFIVTVVQYVSVQIHNGDTQVSGYISGCVIIQQGSPQAVGNVPYLLLQAFVVVLKLRVK